MSLVRPPTAAVLPSAPPPARQLEVVDRYLPVWVLSAMAGGLLLGRLWPGIGTALGLWQIQSVSVPIAIGLLLMMYPILARVRYGRIREVTRGWRATVFPLGTELDCRARLHVRAGVGASPRRSPPPDRSDIGRAGPVHRHGVGLEPARGRGCGVRYRPGRTQCGVPDPGLRRARGLLPGYPAHVAPLSLAGDLGGRLHGGAERARLPGGSAGSGPSRAGSVSPDGKAEPGTTSGSLPR